ncbi:MAG: DNA helicase RecQ [Bacteroidetes bacterium]|nr:MAG: DNA helicase RecQ [Bacteroidota bacterium]
MKGLSPKDALKSYFGFSTFKGQQEAIIENVLAGKNSFVIMPTGGGKSMCYQLPSLMLDGTAIIVSPLIALMKNQVDVIRGIDNNPSIAHYLNSSLTKTEATKVRQDLVDGNTKLLYVAPETLTKEDNVDFFKKLEISFVAIDEAHCISEWGHDFRPEYRRLKTIVKRIADVPLMALTATATPKVQYDIQKNLDMMDATVFQASFNRDNLYYQVKPKTKDVIKDVVKFIRERDGKSGIVYCLSRKKVEEIAESLQVNGIKALPYHAGLESSLRAKNQDMFLMEDADVIVATIAFGMGIDKPDIRFVIHHDIPKSLEGYYQETGRAGRDGGEGNCLAFYSYADIEKLEKFLHGKPVAEQEIGNQLLQEIVSYSETSVCRRRFILYYFGEDYKSDDCKINKMCDNCEFPKEKFEGMEYVVKVMTVVDYLNEKHKGKYIVNILIGKTVAEIKTYKHDTIPLFGSGKEKDGKFWNAVIRQLIVQGLLEKQIEKYGVLRITEKGRAFINEPHSIMLIKEQDYTTDYDESIITKQEGGKGAVDEVLFKMLKELRKDIAHEKKLPPFVIFQDPSLEEMCFQYPISMDNLTQINGVGKGKALKYGEPFIELIKDYVEENEIERPDDFLVKSVINKSGLKVYIIQNIDRKVRLEDMAKSKGLELENLITEIEAIVSSGTKVNIKYCINDMLDDDSFNEIIDYFKDTENDNIDAAYEEFDEDFSENELRMVRLQFYSDYAN